MRTFFSLMFVWFCATVYGQTEEVWVQQLMEAETKSALRIQQLQTNANTANYDLKYHRLEFNVDPAVASISGTVTSYFVAKENLNSVVFELTQNMTVTDVIQRETNLSFTQNSDDEVVITLTATQAIGVLDSLSITYTGTPQSSGFDSFEASTHNGDPVLWTLSEPYGAKDWWPCKQDLNDKIDSIDVYLTIPKFNSDNEENKAVSNGLKLSEVTTGDFKTTRFKHKYPIPAYLIAIAVTNYSEYSETIDNNGNPFEFVNYAYPEYLNYWQTNSPVTVDIMNFFSETFGEYPFASEKYGHAQFGWGGGMEHTTISFMGSMQRGLVAHELAHQWFGNKVTCGSWQDIWINEGFATYLSGLVVEELDGNNSFRSWKQSLVQNITSQNGGSVYLQPQDTLNVGRIFNGRLSYYKGAMVLHMLRKKLGDPTFYQGLNDFLNHPDYAFDYAKTADLKAVLESASNEDLTEFFDDWVYNQGHPTYEVLWKQPNANTVEITLNQTQSHVSVSFFEAPVPIRLVGSGGEVMDVVLDHTSNGQIFNETVNFDVSSVLFDPEFDLISRNNSVTLGMEDHITEQLSISIYPNPTTGKFHISKPDQFIIDEIRLLSPLGQEVLKMPYAKEIDVSHLADGLFFIELKSERATITKSLLKN
ncbi:M1 family aminopeptidase [Aegicerativicinus sediminis]|uniref:M1 family aminopeptidase n=1 Tax=Aegicerativicinus sediminis TaxID=2893202 RepID=UPI001E4F4DA5|nr:M1 family aminopeptidase [Aegicerativicinus sediminis]